MYQTLLLAAGTGVTDDRHITTGIGGLAILFMLWGGWHLLSLLFSSSPKKNDTKKKKK